MPIASGAAGRVDAGVDVSTSWTPDGLMRKTRPSNRNYDSYLQRYQEQRMRNKSNLLQATRDHRDSTGLENGGTKEGNPQEKDFAQEKPSSREKPRKSLLCVLI